jgi:addiction module RelE/StbE family toxin
MGETSVPHLIVTSSFQRAAKRTAKQHPELIAAIKETLEALEANMFSPSLRTHKLYGELRGCWACSVAYDWRIVFGVGDPVEIDGFTAETITLFTMGTHDEVY